MCMASMDGKAVIIPNGATRVLVCVDTRRDEEPGGRWYNPYQPRAVQFESVLQLLNGMEELYNDLSFPQPAFCCRSWRQGEEARDRYRKRKKEISRRNHHCIYLQRRHLHGTVNRRTGRFFQERQYAVPGEQIADNGA